MNSLPGTETIERTRISGEQIMFERCPECAGDVTAVVQYEHLLRGDYDMALTRTILVDRQQYTMFSYTIEPCGHELIAPVGQDVANIQATVKRHGARPSTIHPPYLVTWTEHVQRRKSA